VFLLFLLEVPVNVFMLETRKEAHMNIFCYFRFPSSQVHVVTCKLLQCQSTINLCPENIKIVQFFYKSLVDYPKACISKSALNCGLLPVPVLISMAFSFQRKEKIERTTKFQEDQIEQCKC